MALQTVLSDTTYITYSKPEPIFKRKLKRQTSGAIHKFRKIPYKKQPFKLYTCTTGSNPITLVNSVDEFEALYSPYW